MKWFKHDTDCDESEGLSYLIEHEGFAGYGRWFRLLEIVASKMDKTDRCHAEYPVSKWCSLLGLKQKKLKTFLELSENKLKTKVFYSENIIRIEIPNLLKKRDDYTRKSEQSTEKVTPRSKIEDTDKETYTKKQEIGAKTSAFVLPEWIDPSAWTGFEEMRRKIKKPMTDRARANIVSKLAAFKAKGHDPTKILDNSITNSWQDVYEPKPEGAANGKERKSFTQLREEENNRAKDGARAALRRVFGGNAGLHNRLPGDHLDSGRTDSVDEEAVGISRVETPADG